MKKLLSIILAAAMLISLVPMSFAAIDETTGLDTLTYNFNYAVFGKSARFDFTAETAGFATVDGAETSPYKVLRWTKANSETTSYFDATQYRFTSAAANASVTLLEINVESAGKYIPSVEFARDNRGGYLELYIFDDVSALTNGAEATGLDAKIHGDITDNYKRYKRLDDIYIDTALSATEKYTSYEYKNAIELNAGTNYIAIVMNGSNATANSKAGKTMLYIKNITLKQIEAAGSETEEPEIDPLCYSFDYQAIGQADSGNSSISFLTEEGSKSHNWEYVFGDTNTRAIYKTYAKFTAAASGDGVNPKTEGNEFKITVPESGTYIPSIEYQKIARGGHLKVYLTKEGFSADALAKNGFDILYKDITPLDNTYINGCEGIDPDSDNWTVYDYENVTLDAGTYYLSFVIDGTSSTDANSAKAQAHIKNFRLTPVEGGLDSSVIFYAGANIPGAKVSANIPGYNAGNIASVLRGTSVTVTAPEVPGYIFRSWVRGSGSDGIWESSNAEYTFRANTHTMLTAVYTEAAEQSDASENVVEYYNENGAYIDTRNIEEGTPEDPSLVGYDFNGWYVGVDKELDLQNITKAITQAVAKYTAKADTYAVSVPDSVEVAVDGEYTYDKLVTLTSDKAVYWLRDGKAVAYGTTYEFYVWGNTVISTAEMGSDLPKVILDKVTKNGARMIEFDAAGCEIVEAGIIFGENAAITIDSCKEKMVSQRGGEHGQFTATSDCSVARGYVIYKNVNGGLGVIYAD